MKKTFFYYREIEEGKKLFNSTNTKKVIDYHIICLRMYTNRVFKKSCVCLQIIATHLLHVGKQLILAGYLSVHISVQPIAPRCWPHLPTNLLREKSTIQPEDNIPSDPKWLIRG